MITKWAKRMYRLAMGSSNLGLCHGAEIKNTSNITLFASHFSNGATIPANSSSSNGADGIILGTGSTPASDEDYKMENPLSALSGMRVSINGTRMPVLNEKVVWTWDISVTNTTQSQVSISEVGLIIRVRAAANTSTNTFTEHMMLFDRTVLESPLVIAPNENGVLRYQIEFT